MLATALSIKPIIEVANGVDDFLDVGFLDARDRRIGKRMDLQSIAVLIQIAIDPAGVVGRVCADSVMGRGLFGLRGRSEEQADAFSRLAGGIHV